MVEIQAFSFLSSFEFFPGSEIVTLSFLSRFPRVSEKGEKFVFRFLISIFFYNFIARKHTHARIRRFSQSELST